MSLVALVRRMLGRSHDHAEVTSEDVRAEIRERQVRQEARLRGLDLQAETRIGVKRKR